MRTETVKLTPSSLICLVQQAVRIENLSNHRPKPAGTGPFSAASWSVWVPAQGISVQQKVQCASTCSLDWLLARPATITFFCRCSFLFLPHFCCFRRRNLCPQPLWVNQRSSSWPSPLRQSQ